MKNLQQNENDYKHLITTLQFITLLIIIIYVFGFIFIGCQSIK